MFFRHVATQEAAKMLSSWIQSSPLISLSSHHIPLCLNWYHSPFSYRILPFSLLTSRDSSSFFHSLVLLTLSFVFFSIFSSSIKCFHFPSYSSSPIRTYLMFSNRFPLRLVFSSLISFSFILSHISYHILSYLLLFHPILSYPILSYPNLISSISHSLIIPHLILFSPLLSCPILCYPPPSPLSSLHQPTHLLSIQQMCVVYEVVSSQRTPAQWPTPSALKATSAWTTSTLALCMSRALR